MRHSILIPAAVLAVFLALAHSATAQPHDVNVSAGLTAKGAPLAMRGYDPVSYFEQGKPLVGSSSFAAVYGGATYQFVTKANLALFESDPSRYVPQYGGYCAFGVAKSTKYDGDPLVWEIADGKLYLNYNADVQKAWKADVKGFVSKADTNWPRIRDAAPSTLTPKR